MENNQEKFSYTYFAKEMSEIEQIRRKYMPKDENESKLETIKCLDASVTRGAMRLSRYGQKKQRESCARDFATYRGIDEIKISLTELLWASLQVGFVELINAS